MTTACAIAVLASAHGIELYRGRPIFYDLGNFIYNVPPTLTRRA